MPSPYPPMRMLHLQRFGPGKLRVVAFQYEKMHTAEADQRYSYEHTLDLMREMGWDFEPWPLPPLSQVRIPDSL